MSLAALALSGIVGLLLGQYEWHRVVNYRSPYLFHVAPGKPTPQLSRHVVLVIVDGLRNDVAHTLPVFRRVGRQGSFLTARTGLPSLSMPGWTFLTTGAPPEVSGVSTNDYDGPVRVDSLFTEVRRAGLLAGIVGGGDWRQLYGRVVPDWFISYEKDGLNDERAAARAVGVLRREDPSLLVVHLDDVDASSHRFGATSAEAIAQARGAGRAIARIADAAGADTTMVLTSDHGHVDAGGHGGPEAVVRTTPFAAAGPGIVHGARGEISQGDVAPTIAAVLGIARPTHAVGRPVLSLLDTDAVTKSQIRRVQADVAQRFFSEAAAILGGRAADRAGFDEFRESKAAHDTLWRSLIAAIVLALLAVAVRSATRRLDPVAILTGVGTFVALTAALFFGRGLTLSLSNFNTASKAAAFLLIWMAETTGLALVAGLVTGVAATSRGRSTPFPTALGMCAWTMFALACAVGAYVAAYGWGSTWRLPDLSAFFGQDLAILSALGIGVFAGLAGLAATAGTRLLSRWTVARVT